MRKFGHFKSMDFHISSTLNMLKHAILSVFCAKISHFNTAHFAVSNLRNHACVHRAWNELITLSMASSADCPHGWLMHRRHQPSQFLLYFSQSTDNAGTTWIMILQLGTAPRRQRPSLPLHSSLLLRVFSGSPVRGRARSAVSRIGH